MKLVTASNEGYRERMRPYLDSLNQFGDFDATYIGVGFKPDDIGAVTGRELPRDKNEGAPPQTECIQHGSFLRAVGFRCTAGEVIIYTDGDLVQQRHIDDGERQLLALEHMQILVGWNGREGETLHDEATRLGMKVEWAELYNRFGQIDTLPSWNVGFLAMTKKTWATLNHEYMRLWDSVSECFTHQARQQWLISWLIDTKFKAVLCPWTMHYHGHHGAKPGYNKQGDNVFVGERVALFRHHA